MKAETVSRRRRAVTTALIILSAAVLLFAAESLYSNRDLIMFDKDKYPALRFRRTIMLFQRLPEQTETP